VPELIILVRQLRKINAVRSWSTGIITRISSMHRGKEHNGNANKSRVWLSICGPCTILGVRHNEALCFEVDVTDGKNDGVVAFQKNNVTGNFRRLGG
jgi:hypothetical protein